ncbi:hypothetical protein NL676_022047 [Syzygium grande]|nr:hypothetical protein NL676_022047 [Syzygium grande]
MKDQYRDRFAGSPLKKSCETTPERPFSLSDHLSSTQSPSSSDGSPSSSFHAIADEEDSKKGTAKQLGRKHSSFAYRVIDHVKLGAKLSETVKWKLSLGAKVIQEGGRENIFKHIFGMSEKEKFLKASQCYLSTSSGPIAGLLFISTEKVAFCSDRSIDFPSPTGELVKAPYKVSIPTMKIKSVNQSENVDKPAQKYVQIVTEDDYEFWFMGFLRYEKAFKNLEKALSAAKEVKTSL